MITKLQTIFNKEGLVNCKLKFDNIGFCCYIKDEDKINMDLQALEKEHNELIKVSIPCSLEDYAIIVLLHEIGHAKDPKLSDSKVRKSELRMLMANSQSMTEFNQLINSYMECVMEVEETAWSYVLENVHNVLHEPAVKVTELSLALYADSRESIEHCFRPNFSPYTEASV